MTKVLVVGSSSTIAEHFCQESVQAFDVVTASSSKISDLKIDFLNFQLPDISGKQLTHAIIFSSATDIKQIEEDFYSAKALTLSGPIKLINKLNQEGVKCMVISTTAVFDEVSTETTEKSNTSPSTTYGHLKLELERLTLENPLNAVMRITKVFSGNSILNKWKDLLNDGKEISCFEDLRVAPLPLEFISKALISWILRSYHGVSHISPDKDMSYYELGLHLSKKMGHSGLKVKKCKTSESIRYKPRKAYLDCQCQHSRTYSLQNCIEIVVKELLKV